VSTEQIITLVDTIGKKVEALAKRLAQAESINAELSEDNRAMGVMLNQYSERIGDMEFEIVELKKKLERKK
jgi:archaellum component FlaC